MHPGETRTMRIIGVEVALTVVCADAADALHLAEQLSRTALGYAMGGAHVAIEYTRVEAEDEQEEAETGDAGGYDPSDWPA